MTMSRILRHKGGVEMGSTWESLLQALVNGRDADYRSDADRDQARRDNLEWIVQTMLEKLRDEE
jgi:hypothetical protein